MTPVNHLIRRAAPHIARATRAVLPHALELAALALLTAAAFVVHLALGLAAAGVACYTLQWQLAGDEGDAQEQRAQG